MAGYKKISVKRMQLVLAFFFIFAGGRERLLSISSTSLSASLY
ncbi:hypothetical protein SD77_3052 [Bacillus badius]|uniref:Uncharacterized protein n=1 Tax=Bacillus badius TaxID=1455 RepID=A0ABR5AXW5_BACBA|nr:hypothetical protein SD78_0352 [Bacillus badius]KIL79186.1 hypothetical protein SD77_3052 [Bacillus badius]